jgi:hypothetical protein
MSKVDPSHETLKEIRFLVERIAGSLARGEVSVHLAGPDLAAIREMVAPAPRQADEALSDRFRAIRGTVFMTKAPKE